MEPFRKEVVRVDNGDKSTWQMRTNVFLHGHRRQCGVATTYLNRDDPRKTEERPCSGARGTTEELLETNVDVESLSETIMK